jgi:hypothetical protein
MPKPQHCHECRDLFDETAAAGRDIRANKSFAHAHHAITPAARRALITYLTAAGVYRAHKAKCPLRTARTANRKATT